MTHIKVYILVYFPSTRDPTMLEKSAHPGGGSGIGLGLRKRHSMSSNRGCSGVKWTRVNAKGKNPKGMHRAGPSVRLKGKIDCLQCGQLVRRRPSE